METTRGAARRVLAEHRLATPIRRLLTPEFLRFVRFAFVGGSGVVVNMAALWLLHDQLGVVLDLASVLAISLAIVNNFLWNNFWTFRATGIQSRRLAQFVVVSLVGMAINYAVLKVLAGRGIHYAPANLAGIMVATAWNFYANSRWTWGDEGLA